MHQSNLLQQSLISVRSKTAFNICFNCLISFIAARTRNVDITITNFLEGSVPDYTPSTTDASTSPPAPTLSPTTIAATASTVPINLSTRAEHFSKSASDRMLSFHERKQQLLENAVRKYVAKFGLYGEKDFYMKTSQRRKRGVFKCSPLLANVRFILLLILLVCCVCHDAVRKRCMFGKMNLFVITNYKSVFGTFMLNIQETQKFT